MTHYFINLTNGIEYLQLFPVAGFVRIQSSQLEAKCLDRVIADLDYAFLLHIALGHNVVVVDASQLSPVSRAIWQGIPWIRYVLNRRWLNREVVGYVKSLNVTSYFRECYNALPNKTKDKLDYVGKFLNTSTIKLEGISYQTKHDSDYKYYAEVLKNAVK